MPEAGPDVENSGFDVLVDAMKFVAPGSFERLIDLMNGFVPLAMVAVDGVFQIVFRRLEFPDGAFGAPVPLGPLGVLEMAQGVFKFAGLNSCGAETEGDGQNGDNGYGFA